ncbi:MAG: sporulation initiation factor Spo0A C-terminal domain-containing protein [Firmicutes bacterium]|nr:sporulation initiation factor Spo0A C-terminal domain-containing protein [Bacillota bacterium]
MSAKIKLFVIETSSEEHIRLKEVLHTSDQFELAPLVVKEVEEHVKGTKASQVLQDFVTVTLGEATPQKEEVQVEKQLDKYITDIFISIGMPPQCKGYRYLRHGVKLVVKNQSIAMTKELYPAIAAQFNTTPSRVERAVRHAIQVCWNKEKINNINAFFGKDAFCKNDKPSNSEFIALMSDKILLEDVCRSREFSFRFTD